MQEKYAATKRDKKRGERRSITSAGRDELARRAVQNQKRSSDPICVAVGRKKFRLRKRLDLGTIRVEDRGLHDLIHRGSGENNFWCAATITVAVFTVFGSRSSMSNKTRGKAVQAAKI